MVWSPGPWVANVAVPDNGASHQYHTEPVTAP